MFPNICMNICDRAFGASRPLLSKPVQSFRTPGMKKYPGTSGGLPECSRARERLLSTPVQFLTGARHVREPKHAGICASPPQVSWLFTKGLWSVTVERDCGSVTVGRDCGARLWGVTVGRMAPDLHRNICIYIYIYIL